MKKIIIGLLIVIAIILIAGLWLYQKEVRPGEKINPLAKTWEINEALATALREDNPKFCEKINKGHIIQDYGVSPKQAREECKWRYVIEKNDIEYCLTLSTKLPVSGVSTQDVCVRELAAKLNDAELCNLMPSKDYIDLCKTNIFRGNEEGRYCLLDTDCTDIDCSAYPTTPPAGSDEGFCVYTGEKICSNNKCNCLQICT